VKQGKMEQAATVLERLRDQPQGSVLVQEELAESTANHEYEISVIPHCGYFSSWANCFKGGLKNPASNLRRTILGTSLQMMQLWTGINFIFYGVAASKNGSRLKITSTVCQFVAGVLCCRSALGLLRLIGHLHSTMSDTDEMEVSYFSKMHFSCRSLPFLVAEILIVAIPFMMARR
jgi:hypothetical protein